MSINKLKIHDREIMGKRGVAVLASLARNVMNNMNAKEIKINI